MRTVQRLTALKKWLFSELCAGRQMKAPALNRDIKQVLAKEPQCYLAWYPTRADQTGQLQRSDELSVCPGILVMPNPSYGKNMEEKRFDRYNGVNRPKSLGQTLSLSILFSIYEPGVRLEGFVKDGVLDMTRIEEGTEQGLFTLYDWMDDCVELLLKTRIVPGTDLSVNEESIQYSLYTDQSFVVDKRPIYYGFVNVTFNGYAGDGNNTDVENLLK